MCVEPPSSSPQVFPSRAGCTCRRLVNEKTKSATQRSLRAIAISKAFSAAKWFGETQGKGCLSPGSPRRCLVSQVQSQLCFPLKNSLTGAYILNLFRTVISSLAGTRHLVFLGPVEMVGNELTAAEAGVDVPGTAFILDDTVQNQVRHGAAKDFFACPEENHTAALQGLQVARIRVFQNWATYFSKISHNLEKFSRIFPHVSFHSNPQNLKKPWSHIISQRFLF